MPPHLHIDLAVPPPGCGRSVTDFEVGTPIGRSYVAPMMSDDIYGRGVPGGALHLNYTGYPDQGRYGDLALQGKIPMEEPGIKPGTSRLVVRSSDHQARRLARTQCFMGNISVRE
jgi:hypothetical protein